jgi:P4 family phage/plasmid primase-like protien
MNLAGQDRPAALHLGDRSSGEALSRSHRAELEQASAIHADVIAERGYRTVEHRDCDELAALGIEVYSKESFPGLLLPMCRATGELISAQFKPSKPILIKGRPVKYLSAKGQTNRLDVHPRNRDQIKDVLVPLWITEGIKKGDSLTSLGCCVVTLTGVFNWRSKHQTLGDWEDIPIKGREIIICFDADAKKNMNVARAMVRLGRWCKSKGAKTVRYLIVPSEVQGQQVKGADDFFAAGGMLEELMAAATTSEPDTAVNDDDRFSDSRLAETIADDVLGGHFVWCKALGWLRWNGQQWETVTEETVGEAVRQYALRRHAEAVTQHKTADVKGWYPVLNAKRQHAILMLAKGIVEQSADAFDADPDLLNTPGGVVDLRTGQIHEHHPDFLMTKITRGSYRPSANHADWEQALTAVREDSREWLQERVGQAITGHPTPDGVIVVVQGGGENGKSAIFTDGIVQAFGDYAAPVSPKLIASSRDEHSTERADLRGQRLLIAEELTEGPALNVTAIKQITDVSIIKARYLYRDNFTFPTSHSLFVTTNYLPVVKETDHGTWRRFALLVCPFTFKKAGEPATGPQDRPGDAGLKARLRKGVNGQHDAIVTWAIEGALRVAQRGFLPLPPSVEADTRAWRSQEDLILAFWDECLIHEPGVCMLTGELLDAFNGWMRSKGQDEWSKEVFGPRFREHQETVRHQVKEQRPRNLTDLKVCRSREHRHGPVPDRPYVYAGVRLQGPEDRRDGAVPTDSPKSLRNLDDAPTRSKRSDRPATFPDHSLIRKVPKGSDRSDQRRSEVASTGRAPSAPNEVFDL